MGKQGFIIKFYFDGKKRSTGFSPRQGWELFTDSVIDSISNNQRKVFMLWGA